MSANILYSFRRCPYAMRARMSIIRAELTCELREVDLKNRPNEMLEISPKGTVPVLITAQKEIIEESLEIMQYARNWELSEEEKYWVMRNDDEFKFHLDRYKYANRYEDPNADYHREMASKYLEDLNNFVSELKNNHNLSDALFPFVRQFANHQIEWFNSKSWPMLQNWLAECLDDSKFKICMKKYSIWEKNNPLTTFPPESP
jgi:glutathione S-transferase